MRMEWNVFATRMDINYRTHSLYGRSPTLVLGVLGEYVARIYDESKRRPSYVVSEFLD